MKEGRCAHDHYKVSTWLLTVTLFLGLFAFSGYTGNSFSSGKEVRTTELVASINSNAKRAASYARAFARFHQNTGCGFCPYEFELLVCFHNRLSKTRTDHHSKQVSDRQESVRFFQRKTFPQNSDEDLFISIRG